MTQHQKIHEPGYSRFYGTYKESRKVRKDKGVSRTDYHKLLATLASNEIEHSEEEFSDSSQEDMFGSKKFLNGKNVDSCVGTEIQGSKADDEEKDEEKNYKPFDHQMVDMLGNTHLN